MSSLASSKYAEGDPLPERSVCPVLGTLMRNPVIVKESPCAHALSHAAVNDTGWLGDRSGFAPFVGPLRSLRILYPTHYCVMLLTTCWQIRRSRLLPLGGGVISQSRIRHSSHGEYHCGKTSSNSRRTWHFTSTLSFNCNQH